MKRHTSGQGLVEYALILVLVAIAVIALLAQLGEQTRNVFCNITEALGVVGDSDNDDDHDRCSQEMEADDFFLYLYRASSMPIEGQPTEELSDVLERLDDLWDEAEEQQEGIWEGMDLTIEALAEGLEVLIDYARDTSNEQLYVTLSTLLDKVNEGDLDDLLGDSLPTGTGPETIPLVVYADMAASMAPRLIAACEEVSNSKVPPDVINDAQQAMENLDDNHPGKAEALQLLNEAIELIEQRNTFIDEYVDVHPVVMEQIVDLLIEAGNVQLAQQFTAESMACGE